MKHDILVVYIIPTYLFEIYLFYLPSVENSTLK